MKNRNISFTRSARLFKVVPALAATAFIALIMQVSGSSAQAFAVADLNGTYADGGSGFTPVPDRPGTTVSACWAVGALGFWSFDGAGNFTASLTLNNAGYVVHPNISGTYTMNADGTGTLNWVSFGTQRRRSFVIGDGGNQVKYVETDSPPTGAVLSGTMVKQ